MKSGLKVALFCLIFCVQLIALESAIAQPTVTAIGVDPLKKQSYDCLRTSRPKKNKVRITNLGNEKKRNVSRAKAKKNLIRSRNQAAKRRQKARQLRRQAKTQERKLLKKIILTPKNREKLEKLKERITKLDERLSDLGRDIVVLKESIKGVKGCGKALALNGNFQFVSGTGIDALERVMFFVGYYYLIDNWDETNEGLCIRRPGVSRPYKVNVLPPRTCLQKDTVQGSDKCFARAEEAFNGRYFVGVAFRNGIQEPGTCDPEPWRCSLSDALSKVNADVAGLSYELVGVIPNGGECG